MGAAEHYRAQRLALTDLYAGLGGADLATAVPGCPAWTVKDVLGHLAGVPVSSATGDMADAGQPTWTGRQVEAARDRSVPDLLAQWAGSADGFEPALDELGQLGWIFTWDVTMHGDDVREALGLPLGTSPTHALVLDGLVARAGGRCEGLGTLEISAGDRSWTVGEGAPVTTLSAPDEGELARALGGRRSPDQVRALAWAGDPEPWLAVLPLFAHQG